ncbi:helix-turn-helix domain-containing protein [Marinicella sp. S1101]|uniref:helix-turn-helix domain-containing protein n=1 Tax=Marinicella marina TaxID=2996016 RepID=UPI002260CB71|nr:helix-turn-helix domain-containing protein [Marinicella marina]MCX7553133.1 helix-turn-helix domain-containing protein [Marinicella marina]MDJ1138865.1 helix-turn-helix domain-containing protein [Marinicella marina]
MILRKLRLQHGWSQEQVAELTDLSVRTIQRIERGGVPSLESAKSLAAVFEVDVTTFLNNPGATDMNKENTQQTTQIEDTDKSQNNNPKVSKDEKAAINYVKGIKEFYGHVFMFVVFIIAFLVTGKFSHPQLPWLCLGWLAGLVVHGLVAFEVFGSFGTNWEKKQIEKKLGRKL